MRKQNFKRVISLTLGAVLLSAGTACKGNGGGIWGNQEEVTIDASKTQLYVGVFDGGLGREIFEELGKEFEAKYAETSLESGKMGVQIIHDWDKEAYGATLIDTISTNRQEVYAFANASAYIEYIQRGHWLDITDVVTEGGENSIESKMNTSLKDFYKYNGKYYALPLMEGYCHFIYDVDLFDKEHLWFAPDGNFVEVDNASTTPGARRPGLSGGEDGWDAGLPETYSEFFILLEEMCARGITPFTWSGAQIGTYVQQLSYSFWADYQGAEEFAQMYTLDGSVPVRTITDTNFVESDVGMFNVPASAFSSETVTKANAQSVSARAAGKYYGLKLAHDIMYEKKYVNARRVNSPAESHLMAQATYVQSTRTSQKIAMLIEGTWWYNEAKAVFEGMEMYGSQYSAQNRRFGIMPFPKADDGSSAEGRTISIEGVANPLMFISNYIAESKVDLAKDYLRFINTEAAWKKFTQMTGVRRPFEYTLTEEEQSSLPYYARNLLAAREDIEIEYRLPRTDALKVHYKFFDSPEYIYQSEISAAPFAHYFNNPDTTALNWFKSLSAYSAKKPYDFDKAIGRL